MKAADASKPARVRDAFHRRVAGVLSDRGFVANAACTALTRKNGPRVERVEFSSSHRNTEGSVACFVALTARDARIRKTSPTWSAGGQLNGPAFAAGVPTNVADEKEADELLAAVVEHLAFFDLLATPEHAFEHVRRRYVPGFFDPVRIAPYLAVHLGVDAVAAYAHALLDGRSELWPAFVARFQEPDAASVSLQDDHGTQLAGALRMCGVVTGFDAPPDVVPCRARAAAHLRNFLGCQLRAWGEPIAAAALRHVPDEAVTALHAAQKALGEPLVDSVAAVRLALAATIGTARDPARAAPQPRHFQYLALHASFASS